MTPDVPEGCRPSLRKNLERLLGPRVVVSVEVVDEIPPEPSGKRPIIKTRKPSVGPSSSADGFGNRAGRPAAPG